MSRICYPLRVTFRTVVCLAGCATISSARADLLAPGALVGGQLQAKLSVAWWQWDGSHPVGSNPTQDTTGAQASLGNQGQVFFLAGSDGAASVTRSATIGSDQSLFFPLINFISAEPFNGATEAAVRQDAADGLGSVSGLSLKLDGKPVSLPAGTSSLLDFRQLSPPGLFDLTLPANNVFGVPAGTYPSASDGYWVALGPLTAGNHVLQFTANSNETGVYAGGTLTQDITYNLDVKQAPEPGACLLALTGAGLALLRRLRSGGRKQVLATPPGC